MTTKLTLSINSKVIESAKRYSRKRGVSLSRIVEEYLVKVSKPVKKPKDFSIMELKGILGKVPHDFDYDQAKYQYLKEKYKL
ncbi:MAG: DUF6364 family protein [Flammeovirgaceae bacterium]|nr:DUF6364 family protein [Flammeovirgaceae bacterium]